MRISSWSGDAWFRTQHRVELPPGVGWNDVQVKVGVYDVASMDHLALQGDDGGENAAVPE